MRGLLAPVARQRVFTDVGVVAPGALLNVYVSGTTTRRNTWSDPDLAVGHLNANPIVASAGGLFGPIYLQPGLAYKFVLTTAAAVTIWSQDPVRTNAIGAAELVTDYGATGDGVTNDAAAIQAAITAANALGVPVYFPPPPVKYFIGTTTITVPVSQMLLGADYVSTVISYSGTGHAFTFTQPINGSGYARVTFRDLQIECTAAANTNTGAGIALLAGGFAYFTIDHCRVTGTFKYGVLGDAIEVACITDNLLENGAGVTNSANLWIVNGDEVRAGQTLGFSNVIEVRGNQFNNGFTGMIDDGGDSITITGNNFNGNSVGLLIAGRTDFEITRNAFENHSVVTGLANARFNDRSGVGGGTLLDKSPCRGGYLAANSFASDMAAGGQLLRFIATTALAYHQAITVAGNFFGNRLGRTAAIDVTRLGRSFCGHNTDDVTAGAHYTGKHNDGQANTLLVPGGTTDSLPSAFAHLEPQLTATLVWDPPNIATDGAIATTTVTVFGAVLGDVCTASHDAIAANFVLVSASVSAADTVQVILLNKTGGAINLASGILRVFVTKPGV